MTHDIDFFMKARSCWATKVTAAQAAASVVFGLLLLVDDILNCTQFSSRP